MLNKRGNVIIIILVLVFVMLGGVAYWYYQNGIGTNPTPTPKLTPTITPDPTADWKTYTNEEYGYSIKYPQNWYDRGGGSATSTYDSVYVFSYEDEPLQDTVLITDTVGIYVINSFRTNSIARLTWSNLQDFITDIKKLSLNTPTDFENSILRKELTYTKLAALTIDGREVYKLRVATQPKAPSHHFDSIVYYIWDGSRIISVNTYIPFESEYTPIIEQMVEQTLKFSK